MFVERPIADLVRVLKACATNQYARFAPRRYLEATGETGRGAREESVAEIAAYFRSCFDEYFEELEVPADRVTEFLHGRRCLEYGPGDLPAVALLMYAHGAEKVWCVDRFALVRWSARNIAVARVLVDALPTTTRERAATAFLVPGDPGSGLDPTKIEYLVRPGGLSGLVDEVDIVYSRAVLEHVDDLSATIEDMAIALVGGGVAVHQVDLRSHGLHRRNPLDFLTWPESLWRAMYSQKGVPNRWRIDRYRDILRSTSLAIERLEPIEHVDQYLVREIRPHLAKNFRAVSDDDLRCAVFWMAARKQVPMPGPA